MPSPPRTPVLLVELPGETSSRLLPSALICELTFCWAPSPRPTVSTTAAMPIRMPSVVSPDRSRCERIASQPVRRVSSQLIGRPARGRACRTAGRRDAVPRRPCRAVRADPAVPDPDDPAGPRGDLGLVGDQHDRAALPVQLVEQAEHVGGRGRVQVAGRLVGQDQRRVADQGPGHRHPLLLAAGQLARPVLDPVGRGPPAPAPPWRAGAARPGRCRRRSAAARRCARRSATAAG